MSEQIRLLKLDAISLSQHLDLTEDDDCFYWREFTARTDYTRSPTNQLITNFKILPTAKHRLHHKTGAINQIVEEFIQINNSDRPYEEYTFVPIPPSKISTHPDFDDRLNIVLQRVSNRKNIKMDIRPLITQNIDTESAHTNQAPRLTIAELCDLYQINEDIISPTPKKIVIFDDVLTKGTHFKAMQKTLQKIYPDVPIVGLFIALSVYPIDQ